MALKENKMFEGLFLNENQDEQSTTPKDEQQPLIKKNNEPVTVVASTKPKNEKKSVSKNNVKNTKEKIHQDSPRMSVIITEKLQTQIKAMATINKSNDSEVVRQILTEYFEKKLKNDVKFKTIYEIIEQTK